MSEQTFTYPDTWTGGFYELALEIGPRGDDKKLWLALQTLWLHPDLTGVFLEREHEPESQPQLSPTLDHVQHHHSLYGIVRLPNHHQVACATFFVREEAGSDWLVFYLPMGALSQGYPVGSFPFGAAGDSQPSSWRQELDAWLAQLATFVFAQVKFELGLIGHEVSGEASATELRQHGLPEQRWFGYLVPEEKAVTFYPPTIYHPPFTF
jgi:hypothetical protein